MGAHNFTTTATGRDANDAYRNACSEALAYAGHQDGYNGTISTTRGFLSMRNEPSTYSRVCATLDQEIRLHKTLPARDQDKAIIRELTSLRRAWTVKTGSKMTTKRFARAVDELSTCSVHHRFGVEKWGNCLAVNLTPNRKRQQTWQFSGWAAS